MAANASGDSNSGRRPDRLAAALAAAFILLLLATEFVLTLPDVTDSASTVAQFYAEHRTLIITLQVLGFVDAALLGAYAWRLRTVDRIVGGSRPGDGRLPSMFHRAAGAALAGSATTATTVEGLLRWVSWPWSSQLRA